ncbi:MAG: hypothetical protein EAZ76_06420 [Nostocales cyanobacterium]|nr:MAG: hypothetical protein EAZ87_02530 [Nostocales cyanobacterium]TAF16996.1 MAG: hypothetical protein EAZ76_06420 [Nostocales cyanobacterium]
MWNYEQLFNQIEELVMHHSPSGVETEINNLLLQKFADLGVEVWLDRADNIIAKIPGKNSDQKIAITAHKDEIGAIVKNIGESGKVEVRKLGGAFPWVYGEWEGKSKNFVQENYTENYINWLSEPAWNAPLGGETAVEIANRAMPVITEIRDKHAEGNILVVSHKATIRIMLCSLLGIDLGCYRYRVNILVASVSVVKFDVNGPLLEVLGDRYHIPDHIRSRPGT